MNMPAIHRASRAFSCSIWAIVLAIQVGGQPLCMNEPVALPYQVASEALQNSAIAWLELLTLPNKSNVLFPRILAKQIRTLQQPIHVGSALRCIANSSDPICDVRLESATKINETAFVLSVSTEVSVVDISRPELLSLYFNIAAADCPSMRGEWRDGNSAIITCDTTTDGSTASLEGAIVSLLSRPFVHSEQIEDLSGTVRFTPSVDGEVVLRLCAIQATDWTKVADCTDNLQKAGSIINHACECVVQTTLHRSQVQACANASIVLPTTVEGVKEAGKWQHVTKGVAALGARSMTILHNDLPAGAKEGGSWGMCFWLWLYATHSYDPSLATVVGSTKESAPFKPAPRMLFFKGPGPPSQERTPSAWLDSNSNRVLMRVSGRQGEGMEYDHGVISGSEIPVRVWTHLCFAFHNSSETFSYGLFVNGKFDSSFSVNSGMTVLNNSAPLYIGKAPFLTGASSLMSDLSMLDGKLSLEEALWHYEHSCAPYDSRCKSTGPKGSEQALKEGVVAATAMLDDHDFQTLVNPVALTDEKTWSICTNAGNEQNATAGVDVAKLMDLFSACPGPLGDIPAMCSSILGNATCHELSSQLEPIELSLAYLLHESHCGTDRVAATFQLGEWSITPGRDGCTANLRNDLNVLKLRLPSSAFMSMDKGLMRMIEPMKLENTEKTPASEDWSRGFRLIAGAAFGGYPAALYRLAMGYIFRLVDIKVGPSIGDQTDNFAMGLMHLAAMLGSNEASAFLGQSYDEGSPLPFSLPAENLLSVMLHGLTRKDSIARLRGSSNWPRIIDPHLASIYFSWAAEEAERIYNTPGQQPSHDMRKLGADAGTAPPLAHGESGEDNEIVQYKLNKAEAGDVPMMEEVARMYYWGNNGVARDHPRAYDWWQRAHAMGSHVAPFAMGSMLLRGEGASRNVSKAIEYLEEAAQNNDTAALNALGVAFHQGHEGLDPNLTRSFEMFSLAAQLPSASADTYFNLAWCYEKGLGTNRSLRDAFRYYKMAATLQQHFPSILKLATMYSMGQHPDDACDGAPLNCDNNASSGKRDIDQSLHWFRAASKVGPWASLARRGFDRYLLGHFSGALWRYSEAALLGFEAPAENAGFLMHNNLVAAFCKPNDALCGSKTRQLALYMFWLSTTGPLDQAGLDVQLASARILRELVQQPGPSATSGIAMAAFASACRKASSEACYELSQLISSECVTGGEFCRGMALTQAYLERSLQVASSPAEAALPWLAIRWAELKRVLESASNAPIGGTSIQLIVLHSWAGAAQISPDTIIVILVCLLLITLLARKLMTR